MKHSKEKGMTLVEMLIAIFIFMLLMFGSTYLLGQIYKRYGFAIEQGLSIRAVQHSLGSVLEEMRGIRQSDAGSYPIEEANAFSFAAFSDADNDGVTEKVHYFFENGEIKKGVSEPSGTPPAYPVGDELVSTISENVVNTAEQPLFYYFNSDYPIDLVNNPLAVPVSPVSDIRLVKIDIYYNLDPLRAPDNIRLESFVELRNLKDNW
ncbi:MAG: hypothetical protein UX02_C0001G0070 [Candidatus Moranbacteria bacterium GW2011_GWC1_45_18]|nr:MAG: hypothetical protein UT79_C0002G0327 [Candidatus Moranbacteria bacterium GW2011_GWC2_40_12]KKU00622.1 MAG: hypothetical protein UX02_C0001G0070 [Candidatus Moranbacteria bacterium GW2011_GWC1_45_18]OGI34882.1 MAG: hypothetical protein A2407_03445 [Candidatus Moranbacteria bacterium RIFOXYC1_FULL_44_8]OGI39127.1 MAG: hypothetical protein A2374_05115 [Candidatus Moranbacteria bacterium RIFOXYB1_FULL_44_23]HBB36705.1 hypothetical protein [Candidatus Moranbacteria bacterium]